MLLCADYLLESVGVILVKNGIHSIDGILGILIQVHVILLIYSLQLCVESADNEIAETVSLDPGPVVYLV